jgi:hypothetical protein
MPKPHQVTRRKAKKILSENKVYGKPLTPKQRKMFGARASGKPVRRTVY